MTEFGEPSRPHALRESLASYLRSTGLGEATGLSAVLAIWPEIVGEAVAAHCQPARLSGTELTITIDHPSWSTQLRFLSQQIVTGLNERLGNTAVTDLKMHVRA